MASPVGYIVARPLGDGALEPYDANEYGVMSLHATPEDARALRLRWGGDPDTWRVFALVETDA